MLAALGALLCSSQALAAECSVEADGEIFQQSIAGVSRLDSPRCLVRSSSSGIDLTIVDGRLLEAMLEIGPPVHVATTIKLDIPIGCPKNWRGSLLRTTQATLEVSTSVNHAVGRVERSQQRTDVHLICGPRATYIAASAGRLIRFVARFSTAAVGEDLKF